MTNTEPTGLPKIQAPVLPAAAQEAGLDAYDQALDQLWKLAGGNHHPIYKMFLGFRDGFAAPVAAAPGIDLEQFREAVEHWKRDLHDDYKGGHIHDGGEAMRKAEHLLALIDASPKGVAAPGIDLGVRGATLTIDGKTFTVDEVRAALIDASPKGGTCGTCNGHGMIGGLLPAGGGYESEPCPDCSPKGGSDAQSWKLLESGEIIARGDQLLESDCTTWGELVGWEVGLPYNPAFNVPMRRSQATSAEVGS